MKLFKRMAMYAMVVLAAATFTACGGDDDKDEPENPTLSSTESLLIGTWNEVYENPGAYYFYRMTFYKDHTGYDTESKAGEAYNDNFVWSLSGSELTIRWGGPGSSLEYYTIVSITAEELVLEDSYGDIKTYKRIS